jgi:hypothetical protein
MQEMNGNLIQPFAKTCLKHTLLLPARKIGFVETT